MITEIGAGNESKIVIYDRELDGVPESRQIGGTFEIFLGGGFYKLQIRDGRNFVFVDGKAVEVIYENGRWKTLSK